MRRMGIFVCAGLIMSVAGASIAAVGIDRSTNAKATYLVSQSGTQVDPSAPPVMPNTIVAQQLQLASGVRQALPSSTLVNGIVCKASPNNSADVLVGGATVTSTEDGTGNGYILAPGEAFSLGTSSTTVPYFISNATAVVSCIGN